MKKRGMSDVVSTVLIILLVVVAVGIIGTIVLRSVSNVSEQLESGTTSVSISVLPKSVMVADGPGTDYVIFSAQRKPGEGEMTGINVVYKDKNGNTFAQKVDSELDVFETVPISTALPISFGELDKIEVYPIAKSSRGKDFIGTIPYSYSHNYNNLATTPVIVPDGTVTYVNGGNVFVPTGLLRYYDFEDQVKDFVSGTAGTLGGTGGNPTFVSGKVGKSIKFDRSKSQYVSIPDAGNDVLDLSASKEFTISFWHRPYDALNYQHVFVKGTNDGGNWPANLMYSWTHASSTAGRATAINNIAPNGYKDVSPAPAQTNGMINSWNFITLTMDRGSKTFSYYYNGMFKGSVIDNSLSSSLSTINGRFTIGAQKYGNGNVYSFYNGEVDEFKVYNYPMTAMQVETLYNSYA